ncbi:hypothetical protein [Neomesorhizobium albiziae]|uniref:hypothetical protein n=1 Tax=Neomesorhizobium albiziae TaxID=335020 RepID=UPI00235C4DED|nr:hypothetical protein GCM10007937_45480 [Mesorhizobium albiziae]
MASISAPVIRFSRSLPTPRASPSRASTKPSARPWADFLERHADGYVFVDASKLTAETGDSMDNGRQFVVTISYDARELPIWNLLPGLTMPGMTIARQSTIRVGGI